MSGSKTDITPEERVSQVVLGLSNVGVGTATPQIPAGSPPESQPKTGQVEESVDLNRTDLIISALSNMDLSNVRWVLLGQGEPPEEINPSVWRKDQEKMIRFICPECQGSKLDYVFRIPVEGVQGEELVFNKNLASQDFYFQCSNCGYEPVPLDDVSEPDEEGHSACCADRLKKALEARMVDWILWNNEASGEVADEG